MTDFKPPQQIFAHGKTVVRICLAALIALLPSPASAQEVFGGVVKHNVDTPLNLSKGLEGGFDLQVGFRGGKILRGIGLQPYVFGAVNLRGETSYAAAGVGRKFGERFYVRPGLGLAIHNGSADKIDRRDRIAFGSRILVETEVALGARLNDRLSLEASWVHLSHGQFFGGQNPGIDNIGARINLKL